MPRRRSKATHRDPFDQLDGPVADELDLHGFSGVEARVRVPMYLETASRRHAGKVVRIITGKGRNSSGTPVLKPLVRKLLKEASPSLVAEFDLDLDEGGFRVRLR